MISKTKQILRSGFTTGVCAQAASKAASYMLMKQCRIDEIDVVLPNGVVHKFQLLNQTFDIDSAGCGVIKDAGGDTQDITNGIEIVAKVKRSKDKGIRLIGGSGVGKVTMPGLTVAVGEAAINPIPKKMIIRDVSEIIKEVGCVIEISVPKGEEIAQKTQNSRLGIIGGISIIGTRGIVEPKSLEAYKVSLRVSLNVACRKNHQTIYIASGYISERVLKEIYGVSELPIITAGDHIGFMLKECVKRGVRKVVLIGHIGKLVKIAAGIFNTHYSSGDKRMETIAVYAARNGATADLVAQILDCRLAEATVEILREKNLMNTFNDIAKSVVDRAAEYTENKIGIASLLLILSGDVIGAYPIDVEKREIWDTFIL